MDNPIRYLLQYYSMAFAICLTFYLAFCVTDILYSKPTIPKLVSVSVIDDDGTGETVVVDGDPITLKKGQNILVRLYVERKRSGTNEIERILITKGNVQKNGGIVQEEKVLDHITRSHEAGTKNVLYVVYNLDKGVTGCGYVYSRNTRTYSWNILTYIKPIITNTPKINFCIGE